LTEQFFPLDLQLPLPYRAPHEFRDNRTLILITEGLVKCRLNVIGNTKVNGGHGQSPLLKSSTIKLYASLKYGQSRFHWIFAQFSPDAPAQKAQRRNIRHLSRSVGAKQNILAVNLTVKLRWCGGKSSNFKQLRALETIEWE
jgi:hypothetical protein